MGDEGVVAVFIYYMWAGSVRRGKTETNLTLCRSNLKLHCMGRKAAFFQQAFKFTYYTRNRSPLQKKKIIKIKLEKTE